jgi:hypothetical protein
MTRFVTSAPSSSRCTVLDYRGIGPFHRDFRDYAMLFAWNHRDDIFEKDAEFALCGKGIIFGLKVGIIG